MRRDAKRALSTLDQHSARYRDIYLYLALLLSLLAALPLLIGAGAINTRAGGDVPFMWQRVHQLSQNLRGGVFPARWMPDGAYGLGYPAFNYYASLPYYLAALLNLSGCGILWGIKLTQTAGFLLAGWGAYCLAREIKLGPAAALATSAAYTFAPFHLVNVYVRGDSLAEFWAMGLLPLILWTMLRLLKRPSWGQVAALATSYAALIICHNITALLFTPWLGLWLLAAGWHQSQRKSLFYGGAALALALLLSIWFWAPALRETSLVQLGDQTSGYFHYAGHFRGADLVQWRPWHDYTIDATRDPFSMGLVQAILGLIGLAVGIARWHKTDHQRVAWLMVAGAALVYTLLITPWSRPLWDHLPLLDYAQFPWRMLSLQALAIALLVGPLVDLIAPSKRTWLSALLALCLAGAGMAGLEPGRIPIREGDITLERLMRYETFTSNIGGTVRYEYLPQEMAPRPYTSAVQLAKGHKPAPLVLEGALHSAMLNDQGPISEAWDIETTERSLLAFHTTFFPGWEALVDGQPQGVEPLPGLGLIGLRLEAGRHTVKLFLGSTPTRRLANWASLAGLAVLALLVLTAALQNRRYRRSLAITACLLVTWGLVIIIVPPIPRVASDQGPAVMDFGWAPYLHHEPEGIFFERDDADDLVYSHLADYTQSAQHLSPGETLVLDLTWAQIDPNHSVRLRLQGATAHYSSRAPYWAEVYVPLTLGRQSMAMALPEDIPPGLYVVALSVRQHGDGMPATTTSGQAMDELVLAPLQIAGHRQAHGNEPVLATYGPENAPAAITLVELRGERVDEDRLEVKLTWLSESQAPQNYELSVRLYDGAGVKLEARDVAPLLGGYPTSLWRPGELITDRIWLKIADDYVFTGEEQIEVILYDVRTLQAAGSARLNLGHVKPHQ